jgi:hypothetical protein|tara:strand:- start:743 stop:943 length:201 start_codon:yes stop_codon:yes gene_type:complete
MVKQRRRQVARLTYGEAWTQASEQSGLSEVSPSMGIGFTVLIVVAEVLWWVGVAWLSRKGYKAITA